MHDGSEAAPQFELRSDALVLGTFPSTYVTANINFQNVNDAPVFQNSRTTKIINAGESLRLTEADLGNLSDPDTADPALVFNVNLPTNSLKLVNADTGDLSVTSFTLADVKNNKISLQALNSISLGTYQATVSCVDGQGGTANLNLGIAVDMPGRQKSYIKSLVVIMNSMEPQVMTTDDLKIVFPDSSESDLLIHVDVSSGLKFLSSSTLTEINQFTYQDVIDGKISIQRKTGALSIEGSLVRLRLEDQSDTTQLTDYYDSIVYVGTSSILYADASSSVLAVPSGTQTTLSWEAMGMRVKSAMIGNGPPSNLYSYSNSIGQLVGNTVFLNNAASPSNPFASSFNLIPTPNVSWGSLDFSNSSGTRYGWARNGMSVKYVVDYAQADAPVVMSSGFKAIRGQTSLITPADLDIRDADSSASQIIINLRNVKNGRIELVNAPNLAANTFTMQDVFDGNVLFRHDGSNLSPSYELAVTNPNMHSGVNLFFKKVEGSLISKGIDLAPNPDWLNLGASLLSMDVDLDTSPENVTVSLSNIQGMSGYNPSSSPLVFTWRDYTERLYFRGVQVDTNGVQMTATVNDGNSSVSAQITVSTSYENQTDSGLSATMYLNEEGGRNLVNPSLFKYTKISQAQLATFNVDSIFGMHLELLSNPGVMISTFDYRQLDSGQLVAVYGGGDVLPQLSLSINQSFTS
ncbi:MAG: hypothetical protein NWS01_10925, partial [Burkholderiales bacterium]|nr:hypothetical protein [Burkholderiales bacterium]